MTIATTLAALQTVADAITGIDNAPTSYPASLNTADMPICICWPNEAESSQAGPGFDKSIRWYELAVYVMPIEQGRGVSEGWADAQTYLQQFIDAFLDSGNRSLTTGTYQAQVIAGADRPLYDNGLEVIAYPPPATGTPDRPHYYGFRLRVPVKETWSET